jgi:hypothetical protein
MRYVALYNHQLPQPALKSKTPMGIMTDWHASHPHLFVKQPYDHPGCGTYQEGKFQLCSQPHPDAITDQT